MQKLLMIISTLLILSSCNISIPSTGIQDTYTIFIDSNDKVSCFIVDYDYDIGERVGDWVRTDLVNCNRIHGVRHDVFYEIIEPNIRELAEICRDSEHCN